MWSPKGPLTGGLSPLAESAVQAEAVGKAWAGRNEVTTMANATIQIRTIFKAEVIDAYPQETLAEAARRMRENEVSSLAVVQDDQLLGILTERDLVQALSDGADPAQDPGDRLHDT